MALRDRTAAFLDRADVRNTIIGVILFNAVILGMETSSFLMLRFGVVIKALDVLCLAIFVLEIGAKVFAHGPRFFRNPWNIFDFTIVGIALVPVAQGMSVLRALRILRILRIISVAPRLRRVVEGFIAAVPGMGSVFLLMAIIFYIGAVIATKLFAASFPEFFGTLGRSGYSLFQIMTLESWSMGIVRPVMAVYPWSWAFFIPFIIVTTFAVVNLLVGLIVNSMHDAHHAEDAQRTDVYRDEVLMRLEAIEKRLPTERRK